MFRSSVSLFSTGATRTEKITVEYGVIGLPVTFFIGADGVVEGRWVGAVPEDKLESWVQGLIAGSAPEDQSEGETPDGFFPLK